MGELVCSNTLCHFAQVSEHMYTWRVGLVCRIGSKCKTCKSTLHQPDALYCQGCAYSKVGARWPAPCFCPSKSLFWLASCYEW